MIITRAVVIAILLWFVVVVSYLLCHLITTPGNPVNSYMNKNAPNVVNVLSGPAQTKNVNKQEVSKPIIKREPDKINLMRNKIMANTITRARASGTTSNNFIQPDYEQFCVKDKQTGYYICNFAAPGASRINLKS